MKSLWSNVNFSILTDYISIYTRCVQWHCWVVNNSWTDNFRTFIFPTPIKLFLVRQRDEYSYPKHQVNLSVLTSELLFGTSRSSCSRSYSLRLFFEVLTHPIPVLTPVLRIAFRISNYTRNFSPLTSSVPCKTRPLSLTYIKNPILIRRPRERTNVFPRIVPHLSLSIISRSSTFLTWQSDSLPL